MIFVGAYEYVTKKKDGQDIYASRLFIYYNGRVKENNDPNVTDSGCSMTCAIEALEEYGVCLENIWPYDISQVNVRPSAEAYQSAKPHKITEALQINIDLNEMKTCLAQGYPFAFGLKLYKSFDDAVDTGVVPIPNVSDGGRQSDGRSTFSIIIFQRSILFSFSSHALLAVGYSDQSQSFIVRNSWGVNWV